MSYHWIELTIEAGGGRVNARFVCGAGDGAPCHQVCDRCEGTCFCEGDGLEPALKDIGECNICVWLNEGGTWEELYDGPATRVRSGAIEPVWIGDHYGWRYNWRYHVPVSTWIWAS